MPKFDDRFARQNRCEPPPEFPLASPYSGIVHHLSGPTSYARTQIHPKTSGSVDGAPPRRVGRLLGPCFKTGRLQPLRQHPRRSAVLGPGGPHCTLGYNTPREELRSQGLCPAARTDAGLIAGEYAAPKDGGTPAGRSGVSHGLGHRSHTGFSPSMTPRSKGLRPPRRPKLPLQITTRTPGGPDFKFELLPLHSPLLRQSLLVSFPPLIDMLKFSGYPCLIRGQSLIDGEVDGRAPGGTAQAKRFYYA
ncbi:MAG: hypothetical protein Q9198_006019 [Flavoplaca austrocitrina]